MVAQIDELQSQSKTFNTTYYDPHGPGMEDIRRVRKQKERYFEPSDTLVGKFGIVVPDGRELSIFWKVDGHRKDKRHGAVDPEKGSGYGKSLFDSMFAKW